MLGPDPKVWSGVIFGIVSECPSGHLARPDPRLNFSSGLNGRMKKYWTKYRDLPSGAMALPDEWPVLACFLAQTHLVYCRHGFGIYLLMEAICISWWIQLTIAINHAFQSKKRFF